MTRVRHRDIPGPVVSVLAAGLQVKVIQGPVLQLLAEILDADLQRCHANYVAASLPGTFYMINLIFVDLSHPSRQVELPVSVEAQDGVKVARGAVKKVFPLLQGVRVTNLLQA